MFFRGFIEPDKMGRRDRSLLGLAAAICIALAMLQTFSPLPDTLMQPVYYAGWLPVVAIVAWGVGRAVVNGSRAAKIQAVAWSPLFITGLWRIGGNLGLAQMPVDAFAAFYVSVAIEVLITALGVADRFMTIKRERDRALAETRSLTQEVERDELTGLLNRRHVREHFDRLFAAGFDTMALVDLDHFKRINDTHGHAVGDEVLRSVGDALQPDENALAVRMGGEEFLLLLRGVSAGQRAEQRRRAITARIAARVPGLDFPVTASMGLVSQSHGSRINPDFSSLYAHCDRLLYEAKRAGRNRTMSERMTRFGHDPIAATAPKRASRARER